MESTSITPNFVNHFKCIGSACEDSCCYGWRIQIDKTSYKKVSQHPELRQLAKTALKKIKKGEQRWAVAQLDDKGACQFLDDNSLCQIHAKAGEQYLSQTCQKYPRVNKQKGLQVCHSLSLSCPEAVRVILLQDDGFQFEQKPLNLPKQLQHKLTPESTWVSQAHQSCVQLLLKPHTPIEQSLLAIGVLMKSAEAAYQQQGSADDINTMQQQLMGLLENGQIKQHLENIKAGNKQHKLHAFSSIHMWLNTNQGQRGRDRLALLNEAIKSMADDKQAFCFDHIDSLWHNKVMPQLQQYPELLHRYGFYYLYHMNYPQVDKLSPNEAYRLMMVDFFMIRVYLTAMTHFKGELTEADLVLCFQVYHTNRQHKVNYSQYIINLLDKCGFVDVPSVVSLLAPK